MNDQTALNFIESFYEDVVEIMSDADKEPNDPGTIHYRLGVRRLACAFFHKFELFGMEQVLPKLSHRDVDAWFSKQE